MAKFKEEWRPVKDYEGLYEVSNHGRVRRIKKWDGHSKFFQCCEIRRATDNGYGYLIISLSKQHKKQNHYVHRMVAEAFIENPNRYPQVNHLDYNTKNNFADNLEWCTAKQNTQYSNIHMHKPRENSKTNSGERYITYRESNGRYRVTVNLKEYGAFKKLEDAVRKRNQILKETGYA